MKCTLSCVLCLIFFIFPANSTIDINMAEYQYIADHLTEEECHYLVAALHFRGFDLPKEINSAERRLPDDVSCLDLLLHWNSTPREGKGETHVEVSHRLNQIGREDLAEWLSRSVFHQLSKDLKAALNTSETEVTTISSLNLTEIYVDEEVTDEAAWWKLDSFLTGLIVCGVVALVLGSFFVCYLCVARNISETRKGYKKLPTREN